jgi:hypothetical protein
LIELAFAQIGVHLVFFRHMGSGPGSTNNILALAFGRMRPERPGRRCTTPWAFPAHCTDIGIMLLLRLAMIQTEPVMTRKNDQHAPA